MVKSLYLDCHAGIAGDMFLSALVDLGADANYIIDQLKSLPLNHFELHFSKKDKKGIQALTLTIDFEEAHHHRKAKDIYQIINNSDLPQRVKKRGISVFEVIAQAEAKIHGMDVNDVHFHEVGAMDSIIDIIGSCLALESLAIDNLYASPIPTGHGKINIAHGIYPIPAPATAEILTGVPLAHFDVAAELTTPTGAGFIKALVKDIGPMPNLTINRIGYGGGNKDFDFPNIVRVIEFTENKASLNTTNTTKDATPNYVQQLECQIDDMTAESLGFLLQALFNKGALDVYYTPIIMKKSRPATLITMICRIEDAAEFEDYLLQHTTTLGVRSSTIQRQTLVRQFQSLTTKYGVITVKLGLLNNQIIKAKPEFEDVKRAALQTNIPFMRVYQDIEAEIHQHILNN
ncbi:nickel pincer cofactor biosynthesis protein LarC [Staphylococcus gallinarum]|uniref:nickel pincer cofactor biosynthesis protein LarC n=1 Tax=Staphylococcus gallinarum TaxID=1293 RepID=UPI001E2C5726|nr:nickel pincer cofactor biosynthesis protein LarC [Staphylococcus gallinarum]MCD8911074.1 nickel pincer cofactor biosynthesis protein LarC [Staphylococcus gallinarum]